MAMTDLQTHNHPYRKLGATLLEKLGNDRSLVWLADQTMVSRVAVSLWVSGKCRPKPKRLGYLLAILEFSEDDIPKLSDLAGYNTDVEYESVLRAYRKWHEMRDRMQLESLASGIQFDLLDKTIALLSTDKELWQAFQAKYPDFLQDVTKYLCERAGLVNQLATEDIQVNGQGKQV